MPTTRPDLFLSTSESSSGQRMIAQETSWAAALAWESTSGTASQIRSDTWVDSTTGQTPYSNGIPLVASQQYFMKMVHQQGGGGTESCVYAKLFSDPDPASGTPSDIRGSEVGAYVPQSHVNITNQPQSVTVNNYASTTFKVQALDGFHRGHRAGE